MAIAQEGHDEAGGDPIIYFTLIDFLIQIIFCFVFAFVVYQGLQAAQRKEQPPPPKEKPPPWVNDPIYIPVLRGMTPFINAENAEKLRELFALLQEHGALDQFLKFLQQTPEPMKVIDQCLKNPDACKRFGSLTESDIGTFMRGVGVPPCIPGAPQLFVVDAFDDRLVVLSISEDGRQVLAENNIALSVGQVVPKATVRPLFAPLDRPDCRHYAGYVKRGDSEDMRYQLERSIRLSIRRPRLP